MKLSASLLLLISVLFLHSTWCLLVHFRSKKCLTKTFATKVNDIQAKSNLKLWKVELSGQSNDPNLYYDSESQIQETPYDSSSSHAIAPIIHDETSNLTRRTRRFIPFITKLQALKHYHENFGSVNSISSNYLTPRNDPSWPTELQGIHLGAFQYLLRKGGLKKFLTNYPEYHDFLKSIDFQWEHQFLEYQDSIKLDALQHYYTIFGHSDVKQSFVVPNDIKNWPRKFQGIKLGRFVCSIRLRRESYYQENHPDVFDILKTIKFNWKKQTSWSDMYKLFEEYFNNYGHLDIKTTFRVPFTGGNWTEKFRGANLGSKVCQIRRNRKSIEVNQQKLYQFLNDKGFSWRIRPIMLFRNSNVPISKTMKALLHYNATQGSINCIGSGYKIHTKDSNWPEEFQGIYLGAILDRWRKIMGPIKFEQAHPKEYKLLEELDFQWHKSTRKFKASLQLEAMQVYNRIYGNINNIPICFIVNVGDEKWPSKFHGMRLGQKVYHIRRNGELFYSKYYPHLIKTLEEIKFAWKTNSSKEKRIFFVFHALEHYFSLHGNLDMSILYKVLSNDPKWPRVTNGFQGLKLGLQLESIKYERKYYEANFPKLYKLLKKMGLKFKNVYEL